MREFGLIGYPLGHAYSQQYFEKKFTDLGIDDAKYTLFPISDISKIRNIILSHKNLIGLNVTTPYKELVIPYIDEFDETIIKLGTVNTIKIIRNDDQVFLKAYNTDVLGLRKMIENIDLPKNAKALILGSGGSGKTVAYVLKERGIDSTHVSRNPSSLSVLSYESISKAVMNSHQLIINASPVGMYPQVDNSPNIPYKFITPEHKCFDLVYNPAETLFIEKCAAQGAFTKNGLDMLYEQADKAWEIWNDDEI